jgi:hypothetical protein
MEGQALFTTIDAEKLNRTLEQLVALLGSGAMNNGTGVGGEHAGKRQLNLKHFCEVYDVPYQTVFGWIHAQGFPAYKIDGKWYVDVKQYEAWRAKR